MENVNLNDENKFKPVYKSTQLRKLKVTIILKVISFVLPISTFVLGKYITLKFY
jgi:hypothetical protein